MAILDPHFGQICQDEQSRLHEELRILLRSQICTPSSHASIRKTRLRSVAIGYSTVLLFCARPATSTSPQSAREKFGLGTRLCKALQAIYHNCILTGPRMLNSSNNRAAPKGMYSERSRLRCLASHQNVIRACCGISKQFLCRKV